MSEGIFMGICEKDFYLNLGFPPNGEIFYFPRQDFTYDICDAVGVAYKKAIETDSIPIVACLQDNNFVGKINIPLTKIKFIVIEEKKGLEDLIEFYKERVDQIPYINRKVDVLATLHELGLKGYKKEKDKKTINES
jgi:hypothetical protein